MNNNSYSQRLVFLEDLAALDIDLTDITFSNSDEVNEFYDQLEQHLGETGRKWYFLVNYRNTKIHDVAWVAFAARGKRVNLAYSLGSVRYAARTETEETILDKSKKEKFDPNLFPSREAALEKIEEMRKAAGS